MRQPMLLLCLSLLVAALGCTNRAPSSESPAADGPSSPDAARGLTIAVIPKSVGGEFWETVETGARAAAHDLGVDIKWDGPLTETQIAEQNKIIENMINLGVDGIALAPLNPKAMRRNVAAAVEAGIPVLIFDSAVDGDKHVSFVATDNQAGGALGGQHMVEQLGSGKRQVLVLRFMQGTASTEARVEGFMKTVTNNDIEIVADPYPEDGTVAGSKKAAANALEAHIRDGRLELDGLFTCNLYSTLGMAAAIDDLRKSGIEVDVVFIGFDTSDRLLEGLQNGHIDALVSQNPRRMAYLAVDTLVKHLRGKPIEPVVDTGVELVTAERLQSDQQLRKLVGLESSHANATD